MSQHKTVTRCLTREEPDVQELPRARRASPSDLNVHVGKWVGIHWEDPPCCPLWLVGKLRSPPHTPEKNSYPNPSTYQGVGPLGEVIRSESPEGYYSLTRGDGSRCTIHQDQVLELKAFTEVPCPGTPSERNLQWAAAQASEAVRLIEACRTGKPALKEAPDIARALVEDTARLLSEGGEPILTETHHPLPKILLDLSPPSEYIPSIIVRTSGDRTMKEIAPWRSKKEHKVWSRCTLSFKGKNNKEGKG